MSWRAGGKSTERERKRAGERSAWGKNAGWGRKADTQGFVLRAKRESEIERLRKSERLCLGFIHGRRPGSNAPVQPSQGCILKGELGHGDIERRDNGKWRRKMTNTQGGDGIACGLLVCGLTQYLTHTDQQKSSSLTIQPV